MDIYSISVIIKSGRFELRLKKKKKRSGEGNDNPLQCSCLDNPRDRGAWWATVCGVAQIRTRLKWFSSSSSKKKKKKRRDSKISLFFPLPPSPLLFPPAKSPRKDHVSTHWKGAPKGSSQQTSTLSTLGLRLPASRVVIKQISVVQATSLWYFVIAPPVQ